MDIAEGADEETDEERLAEKGEEDNGADAAGVVNGERRDRAACRR